MWSRRRLLTSSLALLRRDYLFPVGHHLTPSRVFHTRLFLLFSDPLVRRRPCSFRESKVWGKSSFSSSESGHGGGPLRCWNCGVSSAAAKPFLACGSCGSVQPVDPSVDYFRIFGLERTYDIKDDNLEGKYKDWQKKLHPDLVHTKSENEKAFAAEQSARVIDAYHTLRKPLSRALYLLKLEGIQVDEEKTVADPDLLVEMMEIREAVEEASDSQTLKQIQSQAQKKLEAWSNSFQEAFNKQHFNSAVTSTQRMRYYEKAIEEVVKKL
ncbi:iron-sulfur cluster co-chaperone protein HscB homolog [Typha latifolia]|uniref:iron-sulfur cluster co-chaperone protein HscB homolog n=1 Tax=Typha latifolia TaxID=4733 RepID=UPI003C2E6D39